MAVDIPSFWVFCLQFSVTTKSQLKLQIQYLTVQHDTKVTEIVKSLCLNKLLTGTVSQLNFLKTKVKKLR